MTDAEAVTDETICERNYLPSGWVPSDFARQLEVRLRALLGVIEAHECTCFSCDRDGEAHCDCLEKEAKLAKEMLTPNDPDQGRRASDSKQP